MSRALPKRPREMIELGDYIVPHFNNQFRLDKPPFTYWRKLRVQDFWRERFRSTFSIRHRRCPRSLVDLRLGNADWRKSNGLVGCPSFHTFTPNVSPREGRRRRHVARFIHNNFAVERLRTVARPAFTCESNIKRQTSNVSLVVDVAMSRLHSDF